MREISLPHAYEPRDYQLPVWTAMDSGFNRLLLIWHRRAGKDKTCINLMARAMMQRVGSYYYFTPTYSQGRKIIWEGMDADGFRFLGHIPRELWKGDPNNTEMRIELKNGSIFRVVGSDNIDSIVGTNPVGAIFSEYSLQDPAGWEFIRPILRENKGWALFNGTPRGRNNHLFRLYQMAQGNPDWFVQKLGVDETHVMSEADVQSERDAGMDEELVQQEFYCSFDGGMSGAYYIPQMNAAEKEGRITSVPYDELMPVHTAWDIGVGDATSIVFFQQSPAGQIRVIDYYETSGEGLSYYARYLAGTGYTFGDHIAPHDIQVRELGTGKSRLEIARTLGINFKVARKLPIDDGINAVRMMLGTCWFDADKTTRLRDALMTYSKEWDPKNLLFKARPHHDWSSHGADAFRTLAVGRKNARLPEKRDRYQIRYSNNHDRGSWMAA